MFFMQQIMMGSGDGVPITADLAAHFQADADNTYSDATGTLAVDGDSIRQIDDVSGNSNNLDQSTASNQLVFKTDSLTTSGGKYWKASGTDLMTLTSSILMDVSVGCTGFMVCKKDTTSSYAIGFGSSAGQDMLWHNQSINKVFVGGSPFPAVAVTSTADWSVIAITVSGTSPYTIKVWKDSTLQGSVTSAISDISLTTVFNRSSPLSSNDTEYAELMHYDAPLSDTDVVTVSDWLKSRHNIT